MQPKSIIGNRQDFIYSSQGSKKSINSSVKTPALLFYKPSSNQKNKTHYDASKENTQSMNSVNNTSFINQQQKSLTFEHFCENHPNMAAKYFSKVQEQEQLIYYCDRCAHLLKQQGFQILPISSVSQNNSILLRNSETKSPKKQKIKHKVLNFSNVNSYPYPQRQQQIKNFLYGLNSAKQQIGENSSQVRQILINSQEFYGQQIQQINQYFQNIIQSLQLQKNKCYNHILHERQNVEKQTRNIIKRLTEGQREIASMINDIEENLDSVYSISWQNYKLVMDTFQERMFEINKLLDQVRQKGIPQVQYRKIQFAGVPQSINSLSQIIIQNSYGSVPEPDCSLHLTNNSNISSINRPQNDQTIFQKLRTDNSEEQIYTNGQNNLMFSFDGQRMRLINQINGYQNQNQLINPSNANYIYEQSQMQIKLRKDKSHESSSFSNKTIQKVEGIKQVQQVDVVVTDQDQMQIPIGLKFKR